tara:strand:+ start:8199 stop:8972 length:774 start_codon:yes stop_codon:yes gene_type:complete
MIKGVIYIFFLLFSFSLFGQEKGSIGFEADVTYHQFSMSEFNRAVSLRRGNFDPSFNITKTTDVEEGIGFGLVLNYQLLKVVSIGVYTTYSSGSSRTEYNYETGGDFGAPIVTNYFVEHHDVHNLSLGLKPQFYLNKLDFCSKSGFLNRVETVFALEGGYSFGRADFYRINPEVQTPGQGKEFNMVSGTHLKTDLKVGYKLVDNNLFSVIGFSFGYQYLTTKELRGDDNNNYFFSAENTPELDFSGFCAGIYLTFGK